MAQALVCAVILTWGVFVTSPASAATAVTDMDGGVSPADLVAELLGPSVTASNISYSGVGQASGLFEAGAGPVGFDAGVVLSSGRIGDLVPGPNDSDNTTTENSSGGDPDLDALVNGGTQDAAVLEFDFTVSAPTPTVELTFDYVFGSEEYNEYVNSQFNDVFGFFVDGQNCATVGDPSVPVSINTINNGNPYGTTASNPDLYRNNDLDDGGGSIDTELDGLTVVLACTTTITSGDTHHMKLAIADRGDAALDSAVFLRANSFTFAQATVLTAEPAVAKVVPGAKVYAPNLTATLTTKGGAPIAGQPIFFSVGTSPVCSAVTNAQGIATCSGTLSQTLSVVLSLGYDATFRGDGPLLGSKAHAPILSVAGIKFR